MTTPHSAAGGWSLAVRLLTAILVALFSTACESTPEAEPRPSFSALQPAVDPQLVERTNRLLAARTNPAQAIARAPARGGRGFIASFQLEVSDPDPAPTSSPPSNRIPFSADFEDTSLRSIVEYIFTDLLDEPYTIVQPFQDRQVNWLIEGEFSRDEILNILSVFLDTYDVDVVNRGGVYVVSSSELATSSVTPSEVGRYTGTWRLTYLSAPEVLPVLRQFVGDPDRMQALASTNTIVATADRSEIDEIDSFLADADVPQETDVEVLIYEPRSVPPDVLVSLVGDLPEVLNLPDDQGLITASTIDGANQILLAVKDPALVGAVRDFMSASDPPATGTRQNVYYYNLANQEASTVAAAVNRMTGNLFPADLQPTVVELPETNALMITAEPRQYRTIRRMIDRIDYTVPSVLLDATLVEVQLNEQVGYGVEWFLNEVGDDIAFDFSSDFRSLTQAAGAQTTAGLLYLPENWFVVLDLLQDRTELSILSRPRISVSNGDTARLNSTDDIPIVTSEISTQATADANIRTNIERREFGLQLEITPTIADDGSIDLEILIEDSRRGQDESVGEITQPTFNVRRVETNVKVQNGRTILIGGLFQRRDQNQVQGIPGAVDVPVLGKLFGTEVDDNQRTELLVFVTPYVVMDPDTSEALGRTFSRGLGVDERGAPVTLPSVPPANGETADDEEAGS